MSKYNEKSSIKHLMTPNCVHCVADMRAHTLKCFDATGKCKWTIPVHGEGVNGPGWEKQGGDTPPGLYKIGVITETQDSEPQSVFNAYGRFFCDLIELENQEASLGRAGCGVHGGGSASKNPLAPNQGFFPTLGCARLLNENLEKVFVPMCLFVKKKGGTIFFRVLWPNA